MKRAYCAVVLKVLYEEKHVDEEQFETLREMIISEDVENLLLAESILDQIDDDNLEGKERALGRIPTKKEEQQVESILTIIDTDNGSSE